MDSNKQNLTLKHLHGWNVKDNHLIKTFKTKGFAHTLSLTIAIGALCQQFDHHPDYMIIKYSELEVSFSTHTVKNITEKDINIAREIENLGIA